MKMILGLFKAKQKYKLYVDMDGVLTDFVKQYKKYSGISIEEGKKLSSEKMWKPINDAGEKYWSTMEWISDGKKLWNYVKKYNPILLTTPSIKEESKTGKRKWVDKYIGKNQKIIFSHNKEKYASKNNILINDMAKNIDHFEDIAYGGIGIWHKNADKTIKELKKIL